MPIDPTAAPSSDVRLPHAWRIRATAQAGVTVLTLQDAAEDDREIAFVPGHLVQGDHDSPTVFHTLDDVPSQLRDRTRKLITEHFARLEALADHHSAFAAAFPDLPELTGRVHATVDDCEVTFDVDPDALAYTLRLTARDGAGALLTLINHWLADTPREAVSPTPVGVGLHLDEASRSLAVTLAHAHLSSFLAWIRDSGAIRDE